MISRKNKPIVLVILCFICYSIGLSWTILPSIANTLLNNSLYNITKSQYSNITFSLILAGLLISFLAGIIGKNNGLKSVIIYGVCSCFVGISFYSLAFFFTNFIYIYLILGQFFLGIGIAFILTSLAAYLFLLLPNITSIALTGIFSCINLGSFSCPILLNKINNNWGIIALFILSMQTILIVLSIIFLPNIENPYINKKENPYKFIFQRKFILFWSFILSLILYAICEFIFTYWGIIYLHNVKNLSVSSAAYGLSSYWISVGAGQLTVCFLLRYINPKTIYKLLPKLLIIGFFGMFFTNSTFYLIAFYIIGGLGASAFIALTMSFVEHNFQKIAEVMSGIMFTAYFLGYALGEQFFTKTTKTISESSMFLGGGIIAIVIMLLTLFLAKKTFLPENNR